MRRAPAELIVNLGRAVHRDDDIIHRLCDSSGLRFNEQAGGEKGEPHAVTQSKRLSAARYCTSAVRPRRTQPTDLKSTQRLEVSLKVLDGNLPAT